MRQCGTASTVNHLFGTRHVQILVMLLNPVDRLYSWYKMRKTANKIQRSFDDWIGWNYNFLKKHNIVNTTANAPTLRRYTAAATANGGNVSSQYEWDATVNTVPCGKRFEKIQLQNVQIYAGFYAHFLLQWMRYFELGKNLHVIHYKKLKSNPKQVFEYIANDALKLNPTSSPMIVTDNILKDLSGTYAGNIEKKKNIEPMSNYTRMYLQDLYRPHNNKLANLLGEEWRNVWE